MITVIMVGVALAGLILTSFRSLRSEIAGLHAEITGLREHMAHLEGLREAISGRVA